MSWHVVEGKCRYAQHAAEIGCLSALLCARCRRTSLSPWRGPAPTLLIKPPLTMHGLLPCMCAVCHNAAGLGYEHGTQFAKFLSNHPQYLQAHSLEDVLHEGMSTLRPKVAKLTDYHVLLRGGTGAR